MFFRLDYTLLSTSILFALTLSLSPYPQSSKVPSHVPNVQNKQISSQSHRNTLIKGAASPLAHAPNVSSSIKLYHYHHSPNRKRSPAQAITCPSILINWVHRFSICERTRSPQAFFMYCQLAYGSEPYQHFTQYIHQHCSDKEICINTKHNTQAYCVPFENFAQKSFQKFVGVVTDPAAGVVLSVAEAVLTGESPSESMVGQSLTLKALSADQQGVDALKRTEECENCESLTMENIPTGTTGLEIRASVVGDESGNLFVITQV
ncbi:hypothetical protein MMC17_004753 [Xylographa soralifera]|nr:hypothetical protein [Xylographa soralifera]